MPAPLPQHPPKHPHPLPLATSTVGPSSGHIHHPSPHRQTRGGPASPLRHAPYMVALSGWPEPVYVDSRSAGKRSRPGTPKLGAISDGVDLTALAAEAAAMMSAPMRGTGEVGGGTSRSESAGSDARSNVGAGPAHEQSRSSHSDRSLPSLPPGLPSLPALPADPKATSALFPYLNQPVSSARSSATPSSPTSSPMTSHSATPASSRQANPYPYAALHSTSGSSSPLTGAGSKPGRFADPRLAPHVAVMANRGALHIAPSWTGSAAARSNEADAKSGVRAEPVQRSSSGSANSGRTAGIGVGVAAGHQADDTVMESRFKVPLSPSSRSGLAVMRSTPEVYPPPPLAQRPRQPHPHPLSTSGTTSAAGELTTIPPMARFGLDLGGARADDAGGAGFGIGVATEVYPRDPESGILWRSAVNPALADVGPSSKRAAQAHAQAQSRGGGGAPAEAEVDMDQDEEARKGKGEHEGKEARNGFPYAGNRTPPGAHGGDHHVNLAKGIVPAAAYSPSSGEAWSPTVPWAAHTPAPALAQEGQVSGGVKGLGGRATSVWPRGPVGGAAEKGDEMQVD